MKDKPKSAAKAKSKTAAKPETTSAKGRREIAQDVTTTITLSSDPQDGTLIIDFEAKVVAFSDKKVRWNLKNDTKATHMVLISRFKRKTTGGTSDKPHNDNEKVVTVDPSQSGKFIQYKLKSKGDLVKLYKYTLRVDNIGIDPELELGDLLG